MIDDDDKLLYMKVDEWFILALALSYQYEVDIWEKEPFFEGNLSTQILKLIDTASSMQ
jgi:hypothetical protein